MLKDGTMVYLRGNQFPTYSVAFCLLYNKLTGHDILADKMQPLLRNLLEVRNYEEYITLYNYSLIDIFPYNAEQLLDLCVEFNPDANEELFVQYGKDFTTETVLANNAVYMQFVPAEDIKQ